MGKLMVESRLGKVPRGQTKEHQAEGCGGKDGRKTVPILSRNEVTRRIVASNVHYDGLVSAKALNRINFSFLELEPDEFFFPDDPMKAYNEILALIESKARLIAEGKFTPKRSSTDTYLVGVARKFMRHYHHKVVKPLRAEYRLMEKTVRDIAEKCRIERSANVAEGADVGGEACVNAVECTAQERIHPFTGELRGGTPMHVRAERAFNRIVEYLFRIRCTDHALWETLLLVAAAMIVTDCNHVEAAELAGFSKSTWYRKWPEWKRWFRAAARERK